MSTQSRFDALYRAHAGQVKAYAMRRTSAANADDVVAEVFLVVWRRPEAVPEPPVPWLLGTARKVLADQRRGDARTTALHERLAHQRPGDPAGVASNGDPADLRILGALATLGESDRELLMLVAWEGLAVTEAAVVLGARPGTVSVRLHRARRRLADALAAAERRSPTDKLEVNR